MKIKDINESVAGPEKCWPGHRKVGTQPGTGKNAGKRVNDCEKIKEDDVEEAYQFKGPFPFDVDHMHGGRGINLPKAETKKYFTDKKQWERAVNDINSSKYDDNSDYIGVTGRSTVEINGREWARWSDAQQKGYIELSSMSEQGVAEGEYNPEYNDEAGMADNNLETLERAVQGIDDLIQSGDNLPEWCQEKIAVAKSMLVSVWDYMESEEDSDEVDPEIDAMFEAMDQLAEELATKHKVNVDTVWESFEQLGDHELYETAAWRRKEGKSKSGGLNAKGVASYRRENPGSKLQTAVTTKPSKLKPGSKAAKRRKSFCARMSGVKGPMKKPNGKPTRKALALRKWNC